MKILARLPFPFPHRAHTGDEFAYQEESDRQRLPQRITSEATSHPLLPHLNFDSLT